MNFLEPGCLVFDIGANVGQSAQQFVEAGAGHVISVEPCIENYMLLMRRPKTTPIMAAAWNEPKIIEAFFSTNQSGWSSVQPDKWLEAYPEARWGTPQPVPTVTLDMLRKQYGEPFLIKVDVEGSEYEVLQGLSVRCPYLIFEFHGRYYQDAIDCLHRCQSLGFTKAHYVRENLDLETIPTMLIDEFIPRFVKDEPEWGNITVA